ncbi:MAG TPA: AraC family transcriptional regulator [Rhizomicrobium sp.]|nr:AraC family transcriptional regulator [Rhizomicrobium sp.]
MGNSPGNRQNGAGDGASHFPTSTGGIARLAYAKLQLAGIPTEPLLIRAGLSEDDMRDSTKRIRVRDQIVFLNLAAHALRDDFLGFHLAMHVEFRELGLFYYVLASSANLKEAFERAVHYSTIVNEGIIQEMIASKHHGISVRYAGVSRHLDRHQIEFWMVALVRICRKLTERRIVPRSVRFVHMRRSGHARFAQIFGDHVEFGASVDEIVFADNLEQIPLVEADPYLNRLLVKFCEEAMANRHSKIGSFQSSVENTVVPLLPHGKAEVGEIARRLGVSRRTLARRLSGEGLSYSKLLEDLKLHLARRYLADGNLSISQIAWLLGYQEIGAFSRAFKHWTGKTPREARSELAA